MENHKKRRLVELEIKEISKKGNGIGSIQLMDGTQQLVEVPFTIPGDRVKVLLLRKQRGVHRGLLQEILIPSPQRVYPKCIHFGSCGGCRWQNLPYEKQLQIKEANIRHYFAPLLTHHIDFHPILPCNPPWEYRNKMELTFSSNAAKSQFLGLVMDSSKGKVFNLTECHLVNSWFADAAKAVREWWHESKLEAYHPFRNTGTLRTLTLREGIRTGDRMVILTVSGDPDYAIKRHDLDRLTAFLRAAIEPMDPDAYLSIFLRIQQAVKGMPTNFYEMHLHGPDHIREILHIKQEEQEMSLLFKISPSAFFQPNTAQAEQLYALALQHANIPKESVVYDLYCGTGTLGICAAKQAKKVVGIELSPESILDAKENASLNGFENISFLSGSVPDVLKQIRAENSLPLPDVILVDPPRVGLEPEAIKQIVELNPKIILYISCNPVSQVENLKEILPHGYRIKTIHPIDQFPQTVHVENIVVLNKI